MTTKQYFYIALAIIAVTTFLLRVSLFLIFSKKQPPKIVHYLADVLPFFIMPVLVVYCIKDSVTGGLNNSLCILSAIAVTVFMQLFKKNTLLSIIVGTACYMILIRVF